MMNSAAETVGRNLGVAAAGYVELEPDGNAISAVGEFNDGRVLTHSGWHRISDYGDAFGDLLRAQKELYVEDFAGDQRLASGGSATGQAIGMCAMPVSPLLKDGRLVAYVYAMHQKPRRWSEDDRWILRETAERTWAAVDRARAQQALRRSEEKYRTLFNSMDEGYLLADIIPGEDNRPVDILYLEANPAAQRMLDRDFTGYRLRELDPELEDYWYDLFAAWPPPGKASAWNGGSLLDRGATTCLSSGSGDQIVAGSRS